MKINTTINTDQRLDFNMTPMIDCVFQLLIFFLLTLRYSATEGDFNIKMPLAAPEAKQVDDVQSPTIRVRLRSNPDGSLAGILMGERPLKSIAELHAEIRKIVRPGRAPGQTGGPDEVELECDYGLRYEYVIEAISAVSGYIANDGQTIVRLIDKVHFAPPKRPS